jgi:L,D-transpeptidase catalytic domain
MVTVACVASRFPGAKWRFLSGVAVALLLAAPAAVEAQSVPAEVAAVKTRGKIEVRPPGPLLAVVSLSKQRIQVYGSTGLLAQSPVSSGMVGHRTPTGVFSILQRSRFHRSNIYSNAPMPYMQRLTWSGVALHAGVVPGYPASHGCIRLPHPFAVELWGMARLNARVVVAPDDATAVPIEHASLPAPRLTPAPADEDGSGESAGKGAAVASAAGASTTDAAADPPKVRLIDPLQRVKAMRSFAVKDAAAKTRAAKLAVETAAVKGTEARRATAELQEAEQWLETARRRHEAAAKATEAAPGPDAAERAREALSAAAADLAAAERSAVEARLIEAVLGEEATAAAAAVAESEIARREAAAALKASERAEEPISIFVSRKAGKVYIRQAWTPIHEAPVTFKDKDAGPAFGTHVYLAMGQAADGETMNWLAVSLPASPPEPKRQRGRAPVQAAPTSPLPQETAASVLARFVLPEATRRFIEDRLWAGASLIVSDNGISGETGLYTDFIVLTR